MFVSYSLCLTALLANLVAATSNNCPKQFDLINKPLHGNGYVCASVTCCTKWGYFSKKPYHISTKTTTKTRPAIIWTQRITTTKTVHQTYTASAIKETGTAYSTTVITATSTLLTSSIVTELATTTQTRTDFSATTGTETDTSTEISSSTFLTTTTTTITSESAGPTPARHKRLAKLAYPTLVQCTEVDQTYSTSIITVTCTKILRITTTPKRLITSTSTVLETSTILTTSTALSTASTTQTVETDISSTITSSVTIDKTVTSTIVVSSTSTAIETISTLPFLIYNFFFITISGTMVRTFIVDPNIACGTAPDSYLIVGMTGSILGTGSTNNLIVFDPTIAAGAPLRVPDYCLVNGRLDTNGISFKFSGGGGGVLSGDIAQLFAVDSTPSARTSLFDVTHNSIIGSTNLIIAPSV